MAERKDVFVWTIVGLFILSVTAMPLACRSLRPPIEPPPSMTEFTHRLSQAEPGLHIVPITPDTSANGIYVCERPLSSVQLARLPRNRQAAPRWHGVVFCQRIPENWQDVEEEREAWQDLLERWGDHGLQIGPFLLFGDPALLQRIQKAILGQAG